MNRPALVSGASGYLGRALLKRFARQRRPLIALVRAKSDVGDLSGAQKALYDGTAAGVREIVAKHRPSAVYHLAAAGMDGEDDVDAVLQANVRLGAQLADAAVRAGTQRFIAAGTYFTRLGGTEAYEPVSLYAASKKAFQDLLQYYAQAHGLHAAVVCLYDVYGPDDARPKLLNLLAKSARTGEELALSPGYQELDLIHVDDAVGALIAAESALARDPAPGLREWCASSDQRVTVRSLVDVFAACTGLSPKVKLGGKPYRPREVMRPWSGPSVPGWSPAVSLEDGLKTVYGGARA